MCKLALTIFNNKRRDRMSVSAAQVKELREKKQGQEC